jgi:hypothetical protein
MRRRLQDPDARALWEQRSRIIEPRFGQIKQHDGFRRWAVWGLEGVKTQWTMVCATLNLRILYRHWQAGRGPEKENPLALMSLKMAIRELKPSGGIQNQLVRWWQKLLALAAMRSRVRPTGFTFAFAPPHLVETFETVSSIAALPKEQPAFGDNGCILQAIEPQARRHNDPICRKRAQKAQKIAFGSP